MNTAALTRAALHTAPLAVAVVTMASPLALMAEQEVDEIGVVLASRGEVYAEREGSTRSLDRRDPVHVGDTVITAERSRAQIRLEDDQSLTLTSETRLEFEAYEYDPETEEGESRKSLLEGGLRAISGAIEGEDDFSVETPVAVIGVRGTISDIAHSEEMGTVGGTPRGGGWVENIGADSERADVGAGEPHDYYEVEDADLPPTTLAERPAALEGLTAEDEEEDEEDEEDVEDEEGDDDEEEEEEDEPDEGAEEEDEEAEDDALASDPEGDGDDSQDDVESEDVADDRLSDLFADIGADQAASDTNYRGVVYFDGDKLSLASLQVEDWQTDPVFENTEEEKHLSRDGGDYEVDQAGDPEVYWGAWYAVDDDEEIVSNIIYGDSADDKRTADHPTFWIHGKVMSADDIQSRIDAIQDEMLEMHLSDGLLTDVYENEISSLDAYDFADGALKVDASKAKVLLDIHKDEFEHSEGSWLKEWHLNFTEQALFDPDGAGIRLDTDDSSELTFSNDGDTYSSEVHGEMLLEIFGDSDAAAAGAVFDAIAEQFDESPFDGEVFEIEGVLHFEER
ncbi:FecR family protein [Halorhodospira halochloris]|uniref:FecR family protein n=1 Tax=Halorhodospira halochloris TaxID=1052 RepID=UPI001EE87C07|nr:FecR family protein [Halorhodospira halochloris]MCG5548800.1 FecR family protein [Halorhodospira halochloris]